MPKIPQNVRRVSVSAVKLVPKSTPNDALHHLAFDYSVQANLISLVGNGKILLANSAACELLGYSMSELLDKDRTDIFDITESSFELMMKQRSAEGKSTAEATAFKKNMQPFPCIITSAVFVDEDGHEKSITTITDQSQHILRQTNIDAIKAQDVANDISLVKSKQHAKDNKRNIQFAANIASIKTKQHKMDEKLAKTVAKDIKNALAKSALQVEQNNDWIKHIAQMSYDVMWDWNIETGKMYVGDSIEEAFGYKVEDNSMSFTDFMNFILTEEKDSVETKIFKAIADGDNSWNDSFRLKRFDDSIATILARATIIRTDGGKAKHFIGSILDTSRQREPGQLPELQVESSKDISDEKFVSDVKSREKEIADAVEDARDTERSNIGKELHDNINQLLGASRLYLDMAKKGGDDTDMYLGRSSEYTLTAINEIRKLSKGLTTNTIRELGLRDAIENMAHDTMETNHVQIRCSTGKFIETKSNAKFQLNIFRIIQEQLNNILKHAQAKKVSISLSQNKKFIQLKISDNGIGFDTGKSRTGIGFNNIISRAATYMGTADVCSEHGKGCTLNVQFPVHEAIS